MQKFCPSCGCWTLINCTYPQDGVWVCGECDQIWTEIGLEAYYASMNPDKKKEMVVYKFRFGSPLPAYVPFGHRRLEKERSAGAVNGGEERFILPIDLLTLTGIPAELTSEIESITLAYKRK